MVVCVIAILAGLALPAMHWGIEKSRHTGCVSNLRQIYTGLQAYANDNGQNYPVMLLERTSSSDPGPTLDTVLGTTLTDPSVFHCPADRSLFAKSGCSYLWVYALSVNPNGEQNSNAVAPSFPLLQQTALMTIPLVTDKESFHHTSPAEHVMYADGHVD